MRDRIEQVVWEVVIPIAVAVLIIIAVALAGLLLWDIKHHMMSTHPVCQDHSTLNCVTLDNGTTLCMSTNEVVTKDER